MSSRTNIRMGSVGSRSSGADERHKLNDFLASCTDLRKLESKLGGFSLFRVLRFEEGEIRHSNVLAWLFTPEESHGLHDDFLKRFLVELKAKYKNEPQLPDVIEVETARFDDVEVKREWAGNTMARLDLLVVMTMRDGQQWALAIEVKVNAQQGNDQLKGYKLEVDEKYRAARRFYVFLTKKGEESPKGLGFLDADFGMIHTALSDCLNERGDLIASGPKHLIEDYRGLLERRFMPDNDIEQLVAKIYHEHREALDIIFKYRQDFVKAVSARLEDNLKKALHHSEFEILKTNKGSAYLLPAAWKTSANKNEKGVAGFSLFFWLNFYNGKADLRIVLQGGEAAFREKVSNAVKTARELFHGTNRDGDWVTLHVEDLSIKISEEAFGAGVDEDKATEQLTSKTKAALKTSEMRERIAILSSVLEHFT